MTPKTHKRTSKLQT